MEPSPQRQSRGERRNIDRALQAGDRLVAQQVGFDHYLLKPCDPREVVQLLDKLRERGTKAP
jgi:DNA-binding response OmpR family regulator